MVIPKQKAVGSKRFVPFGITPGSMKVASVKLAKTKKVMTPWYAGTHGCLET